MKHVRNADLSREDMNLVVDIVSEEAITRLMRESSYSMQYKFSIIKAEKIDFLKHKMWSVKDKKIVKAFYKELNEKVVYIQSKLKKSNDNYKEILINSKLRELRGLFESVELEIEELKAIPILLKCMGIDYSKNLSFMLENEVYIRERLKKELDQYKQDNKDNISNNDNLVIDMLRSDVKELENKIAQKNKTILMLDNITKQLQLELDEGNREIGYFREITEEDLSLIIKDVFDHSHKMKEKFKNIVKEFEENGQHAQDSLYEMWMNWTDEEVTIIDRVLKKSMYDEVVTRDDVNDLEKLSENIMHRHLLSRLVLHLIYRRMSSQCFEEVLG